ncbi:MAG TPA: glycosyltransferase family 2 protein [Patescibacteria group bacterium]|nr:glycosyltransferase family 2 protein [Patescibacteria group bacterium]
MATSPDIAVVIVNYHGLEDTKECLESVGVAVRGMNARIVLVDVSDEENGERQGETLSNMFPSVHVIYAQNHGFSASYNVGLAEAIHQWNPQYLAILNNDTRVDKNLFKELLGFAEEHPGIAAFTPKIYFEKGYEFHKNAYKDLERGRVLWYAGGHIDWNGVYGWHRGVDEVDHGQFSEDERTSFGTGCCMLFSTETYKRVGSLRNEYFLYYEDTDYTERVKRSHGEIWFVPSATLWHKNAGSSGSGSDLHVYYQTRNRLLFGLRFAPFRTKISLLREAVGILNAGTSTRKEAVFHALTHHFGRRTKKKENV